MRRLGRTLGLLVAFAMVVGGAAFGFAWTGIYNISALDQHTAPVYWLLEWGMRRSASRHAPDAMPALPGDEAAVRRGMRHFDRHCVQCHGAPGVAPEPFAMGLTPLPVSLVATAREWDAAELHWVIRNGIKMSGMPAWKYRLTRDEIAELVAFLQRLPEIAPIDYRRMRAEPAAVPVQVTEAAEADARPGDPARGHEAIRQYGCPTCHRIPGVTGAATDVGPSLEGIGRRSYLGGVVLNTFENLQRWIREPQAFAPRSAMPDMGVSEVDARDIAAYLYAETGSRPSEAAQTRDRALRERAHLRPR